MRTPAPMLRAAVALLAVTAALAQDSARLADAPVPHPGMTQVPGGISDRHSAWRRNRPKNPLTPSFWMCCR